MSTRRQIEANRRNALKSTGPTSVTGKAASSMNALKTGLHAKSLLLPDEKRADIQLLIDEYYECHHPATPEARGLIDDLIRCEWLLRRLDRAEAEMWPYQHNMPFHENEELVLGDSATNHAAAFSKLQYRIDTTRRARDRALKALQLLEAQPAAVPLPESAVTLSPQISSPQIGFVLPVPLPPAPAARKSDRSDPRAPAIRPVTHTASGVTLLY